MIKLIKKGGLRERANRSRRYQGSENTETTLTSNTYQPSQKLKPTLKQSDDEKIVVDQAQPTTDETHPTTTTQQK